MKPFVLLSALLTLTTATMPDQAPLHKPLPNPANRPNLNGHLPKITPPKTSDNKISANDSPKEPLTQPSVALADVLGSQRSLTTFSSFSRLHESTDSLLGDITTNTTVLAPLNSAVDSLPRKPWEKPDEGAEAYQGEKGQERAQQNLKRFVEAHLVTASPWDENAKIKTLGGREVWWVEKDGRRVVMPDEVEVDRVASKVANGELVSYRGYREYFGK